LDDPRIKQLRDLIREVMKLQADADKLIAELAEHLRKSSVQFPRVERSRKART